MSGESPLTYVSRTPSQSQNEGRQPVPAGRMWRLRIRSGIASSHHFNSQLQSKTRGATQNQERKYHEALICRSYTRSRPVDPRASDAVTESVVFMRCICAHGAFAYQPGNRLRITQGKLSVHLFSCCGRERGVRSRHSNTTHN